MPPELEVLEQVLDSELPLDVIAGLFIDQDRCRRAIRAMVSDGEVIVVGPEGLALPPWRYRELEGNPAFWARGTPYRLSITEAGADRIAGHN